MNNQEFSTFSPEFFRFSIFNTISINPPSTTLHISNIKKEICNNSFIFKTFKTFGTIEKIQ